MWFDRQKIGAAAKEIAEHLQIIENVRALQVAQKELAEALVLIGDRMRAIESDMRILKAEVKFEALKETQTAVNAVQGSLNQRIEDLAVRLGTLAHAKDLGPRIDLHPAHLTGPGERSVHPEDST